MKFFDYVLVGLKGIVTGAISGLVVLAGFIISNFVGNTLPVVGNIIFLLTFLLMIPIWGYIANVAWGWK